MQVKQEPSQEEKIASLQRQVDELTTANLLLKEQLARKEQFTAMIAHELRGPLSPIINYAQMLARTVSTQKNDNATLTRKRSETIQRNTNIIISQARRLSRLVNDLLDASRLTSGQFGLFREECDLAELARESVEHLRPVAPYHTLVAITPSTPVMGNWDGGRLQQAIGNLLDNAVKYSDEGTTVTVRVWTSKEKAHISVHNQGASIPSADIGLLFRPYARLQPTSGRQGSGLGLYITKSIIEAHGGALRLETRADEANSDMQRGTTFTFEVPLH